MWIFTPTTDFSVVCLPSPPLVEGFFLPTIRHPWEIRHRYLFSTNHQWLGLGQYVRAGRAWLHHGLRHHQPDQFRARRGVDGGRTHQLDGHWHLARTYAVVAGVDDVADRLGGGLCGGGLA